ncbi:hypothetical protein Tco_1325676, partial [Tanacetum coccineum]
MEANRESDIRERMQLLFSQLVESVSNLHEAFDMGVAALQLGRIGGGGLFWLGGHSSEKFYCSIIIDATVIDATVSLLKTEFVNKFQESAKRIFPLCKSYLLINEFVESRSQIKCGLVNHAFAAALLSYCLFRIIRLWRSTGVELKENQKPPKSLFIETPLKLIYR